MSTTTYLLVSIALAIATATLAVISQDVRLAWLLGVATMFVNMSLGYFLKKP